MRTVEVKWQDAVGTGQWKIDSDLIKWIEDDSKGITWHTGYLFAEHDDFVVLVSGMQGNHFCDAIRIPKPLILEIREVKYVEEA
jgi:hypothetical protein